MQNRVETSNVFNEVSTKEEVRKITLGEKSFSLKEKAEIETSWNDKEGLITKKADFSYMIQYEKNAIVLKREEAEFLFQGLKQLLKAPHVKEKELEGSKQGDQNKQTANLPEEENLPKNKGQANQSTHIVSILDRERLAKEEQAANELKSTASEKQNSIKQAKQADKPKTPQEQPKNTPKNQSSPKGESPADQKVKIEARLKELEGLKVLTQVELKGIKKALSSNRVNTAAKLLEQADKRIMDEFSLVQDKADKILNDQSKLSFLSEDEISILDSKLSSLDLINVLEQCERNIIEREEEHNRNTKKGAGKEESEKTEEEYKAEFDFLFSQLFSVTREIFTDAYTDLEIHKTQKGEFLIPLHNAELGVLYLRDYCEQTKIPLKEKGADQAKEKTA